MRLGMLQVLVGHVEILAGDAGCLPCQPNCPKHLQTWLSEIPTGCVWGRGGCGIPLKSMFAFSQKHEARRGFFDGCRLYRANISFLNNTSQLGALLKVNRFVTRLGGLSRGHSISPGRTQGFPKSKPQGTVFVGVILFLHSLSRQQVSGDRGLLCSALHGQLHLLPGR